MSAGQNHKGGLCVRRKGASLEISTFLALNAKRSFTAKALGKSLSMTAKVVNSAIKTLKGRGLVSTSTCPTCDSSRCVMYRFSTKAARLGVGESLVSNVNGKDSR